MSLGGNGNGSVVERLTRSTAEMTPHERSAQADEMRRSLVALASAHNRLVGLVDAQSVQVTALTREIESQTQCCQDRWDASASTSKRHGDRHQSFVSRSFMARLRWLFRGR